MADVVNIPQLVYQILKISPQLVGKYSDVQGQLLNLILIPHVILFLVLMAFSVGMVSRIIGKEHKGFKTLVGIAAYLYIIWAGWYGTWIVPMVNAYFQIALIMALLVFGISIFWHPAAHEAGLKLLGAGAGEIAKRTIGRAKEKETLEKELRSVREKKAQKAKELTGATGDPYRSAQIQHQIDQYDELDRQIKRKLEDLE